MPNSNKNNSPRQERPKIDPRRYCAGACTRRCGALGRSLSGLNRTGLRRRHCRCCGARLPTVRPCGQVANKARCVEKMLSAICNTFQVEVERLNERDDTYGAELKSLVLNLAKDAAEHVADYGMGETSALMRRCYELLTALAHEAEDAKNRQRRYHRRQAMLSLAILCEGICRFHGRFGKADHPWDALIEAIRDALEPLLEQHEADCGVPPVSIDDASLRKLARVIRSSS